MSTSQCGQNVRACVCVKKVRVNNKENKQINRPRPGEFMCKRPTDHHTNNMKKKIERTSSRLGEESAYFFVSAIIIGTTECMRFVLRVVSTSYVDILSLCFVVLSLSVASSPLSF